MCPLPPQRELSYKRVFRTFDPSELPDYELVRDYLFEQGKLDKEVALELVRKSSLIFDKEPNMLRIEGKVTIVGDVHGQFYDLHGMLAKLHKPENSNDIILLLGDYVDRGCYGTEIVLLLMALKLCYPDNIYMLRGNHESREMTEQFNFREQCITMYDVDFYDKVMDSFDLLPIAAIVNGQYLCMHGGISEALTSIEDI